MLDPLHYSFILRGLAAGVIISLVAPLIGIFLVLRRYSLIADTLSHVSLAGVALGLLLKFNPLISAILAALLSSLAIEKLRISKKVYGESALAIFLSGSLALAIVILSLAHGFNVDLFNYLFGSIVTVKESDVIVITIVALFITLLVVAFFKELVYVTFDEEAARVSGINTYFIDLLLISLAALAVSFSIPIIGVLLISALVVVPVLSALQFKLGFKATIIWAEVISVTSVISGIFISYYLNLSSGGTIVLLTLLIFFLTFFLKPK